MSGRHPWSACVFARFCSVDLESDLTNEVRRLKVGLIVCCTYVIGEVLRFLKKQKTNIKNATSDRVPGKAKSEGSTEDQKEDGNDSDPSYNPQNRGVKCKPMRNQTKKVMSRRKTLMRMMKDGDMVIHGRGGTPYKVGDGEARYTRSKAKEKAEAKAKLGRGSKKPFAMVVSPMLLGKMEVDALHILGRPRLKRGRCGCDDAARHA